MAELRYGLAEGEGKGREVRLRPNIYLSRKGGHFVSLINSTYGAVASLCASGVGRVFGWLEAPKHADGYDAWKGSATANTDKLFCIYADPDNVFAIPANEKGASVNASCIGKGAALLLAGTTYTIVQKAKVGGAITASPVFVVDFDKDNRILYVKVKQTKRQAN
jgi:hypothetical protein